MYNFLYLFSYSSEMDLALEKDTSHQMQTRFAVSEQERQKTVKELERTQLVNRDLVQSLSLFEVSLRSWSLGREGRER